MIFIIKASSMADIKNIYEIIKSKAYDLRLPFPEIPEYISENLKYGFFDWQKDALENLLIFQAVKEKENPNSPTHLMFNMATGTGKTLLMASAILYYYKQGYRHFIFFVNQNNIVDKTENNFVDSTHTKYLFKEKIIIDNKTVNIKKVETFGYNTIDVEIKFTTIQKLYNDIHLERENQTTLRDLNKKNIIMLADEAHHLNADTKNKKGDNLELDLKLGLKESTSKDEIEKKGWEYTVIELILNKSGQKENKNVLLEFTATIPANERVAKKYENKIIYKFGLKEFLSAGYTKEINLISSTLDKKDRILQALLFSWYRHKIAIRNNIANFKPIILFRSKTIESSKNDYEEFLNLISNLKLSDFDFLKEIEAKVNQSKNLYEQGRSRVRDVLEFIKNEKIHISEIVNFIKNNFLEKNLIITNSKDNKTKKEKTTSEQEKLLNNLEDDNNNIRAIFTVARLTEGWDVLNLFDIVRLNQGQNVGGTHKGKIPEATIQEKELIGRGVRYFPFKFEDKQKNKRKFDDNLKNELRVLEELYYYTYDDPNDKAGHNYIIELKAELKKDGYIQDNRIIKTFALKKEFQEGSFYRNVKIWHNKQIDNPERKRKTLKDLKKDFFVPYKIKNLQITQFSEIFKDEEYVEKIMGKKGLWEVKIGKNNDKQLKLKNIEKHIFRKAINIKAKQENTLFHFDKIKKELEIKSVEELLKDNFFGDFNIKIIANKNQKYDDISSRDKLNIVLKFLESIFAELKDNLNPKIGTDFIAGEFKQFFNEPKIKIIQKDADSERIAEELKEEKWYVLDSFYGTDEEQALIDFIKETIGNLESKYKEVYLLRNEEVYKIYDFDKGRGFQPDFILFLKGKDLNKFYYQIFIEPKENEFIGEDITFKSGKEDWKEVFLEQISEKYGFENIVKAENLNYRLIGLPFFNKDHNNKFKKKYQKIYN